MNLLPVDRALSIYAYLIAQDGGNAALIAEADAVREAGIRAAEAPVTS